MYIHDWKIKCAVPKERKCKPWLPALISRVLEWVVQPCYLSNLNFGLMSANSVVYVELQIFKHVHVYMYMYMYVPFIEPHCFLQFWYGQSHTYMYMYIHVYTYCMYIHVYTTVHQRRKYKKERDAWAHLHITTSNLCVNTCIYMYAMYMYIHVQCTVQIRCKVHV